MTLLVAVGSMVDVGFDVDGLEDVGSGNMGEEDGTSGIDDVGRFVLPGVLVVGRLVVLGLLVVGFAVVGFAVVGLRVVGTSVVSTFVVGLYDAATSSSVGLWVGISVSCGGDGGAVVGSTTIIGLLVGIPVTTTIGGAGAHSASTT